MKFSLDSWRKTLDHRIEWFASEVISRGLTNLEACQNLLDSLDEDIDLLTFAQATIDNGLISDVETVQRLIEMADQEASTPESFDSSDSSDSDGLPKLHGVADLDDAAVKDILISLLRQAQAEGVSDIHLSSGSKPFFRRNLLLDLLSDTPLLAEDAEKLNVALLTEEQKEKFEADKDLDFAFELDGGSRLRVNLMRHKEGVAGTYRIMPKEIKSLEDLGFPRQTAATIAKMLDYHNGLILVAGPLGSGKTTTLASLINMIDHKRREHVIAVEDPIEIIQHSTNCNITQREVGSHTKSFAAALKGALREDPDIIVIGELRDLNTIEMAITASETGHLVIGTLHTNNAANTLNRILDVFPPSQQQQIRAMTAGSLRGIICQQLLPATDGGVVAACEILVAHMAVSSIISDGKTHLLKAAMQTGSKLGMCTMDQSIFTLFEQGKLAVDVALEHISDSQLVNRVKQIDATRQAQEAARKSGGGKKKGWFR